MAVSAIAATQKRLAEMNSKKRDAPTGFEEKDMQDSKKLERALYAAFPYPS